MRRHLLLAIGAMVAGCVQTTSDPSYRPVSLPEPYKDYPAPPAGTAIEAGVPVKLDERQQEAVVSSVLKWMKDPLSASFSEMRAARNKRGWITVCGEVNGRNSAGTFVGMAPFIGVMKGKPAAPDFIVVEIGAFNPERADVETLCRESGVAPASPKGS
ncbi:MAG: hypothetical protein JSR91_20200 [Proteobacteria bacterium]|nr:hypothetical protein [Pseudomonadota bacterium]